MGLISPDYGLLFWMLLSFSILMLILKKFAWKPILNEMKNREDTISKSLHDAEVARNEVSSIKQQSALIIEQAQLDRQAILDEAKNTKDRIIEEATSKAKEDVQKILDQARETVKREKEIAMLEIKSYASKIILEATERMLRKELEDKDKYEEQINLVIQGLSSQN